jgi:hypothetical protein
MSRILTITLSTLMLSAPAFADTVSKGAVLFAYQPVGNGDPNAVTCWAWRTTPPVRGLQCARNSYWARLNAGTNHGDLGGDSGLPGGAMSPGAAGGAIGGRN